MAQAQRPSTAADSLARDATALTIALRANGQTTSHHFTQDSVLIGTVPGCDLRLPGTDLPPVLLLLNRDAQGWHWRKLAPAAPLCLVGSAPESPVLAQGTTFKLDDLELRLDWQARPAASPPNGSTHGDRREDELAAARRLLEEERADWEEDAARQAEALAHRSRQLLDRENAMAEREASLAEARQALASIAHDLDARRAELDARQARHLEQRHRVVERLRQQRHQLLGLQESVANAAAKVQVDKRRQAAKDAELREMEARLVADKAVLTEGTQRLEQQRQLVQDFQKDLEADHDRLRTQRQELESSQAALASQLQQVEHDLARLARLQADLGRRQSQIEAGERDLAERIRRLQAEVAELGGHARELDEWEARLRERAQELDRRQAELDERDRGLAMRTDHLAAQQAAFALIKTRMERLRHDLHDREQALALRQCQLDDRHQELQRAAAELERERLTAAKEAASQAIRQRELDAKQEMLNSRAEALDALGQEAAGRQAALDQERVQLDRGREELARRVAGVQRHVRRLRLIRARYRALERQLRQDRAVEVQADRVRLQLQEQLRRRVAALEGETRTLQERSRELDRQAEQLHSERTRLDADRQQWELERRQAEESLQHRQETVRHQEATLEEQKSALAAGLGELASAREKAGREHDELRQLRDAIPTLIEQARQALAEVAAARTLLRGHADEVFRDGELFQAQLAKALREVGLHAEQTRQHQERLVRERAEHHRLVAAFHESARALKERLDDWQARLREDERRLDCQQGELHSQATALATRSLAIEGQERDVAERHGELTRQLQDLQAWYRNKLRELAAKRLLTVDANEAEATVAGSDASPRVSDEALAHLLLELNLVDKATLAALKQQAVRGNATLRSVLLDGEYLTAYQLELIEAGRLEAMVLGSLRIIDRIRLTPYETTYRVFDPRRGEEALLRQLSSSVGMARSTEFRDRFTRAMDVRHVNVAATYAVVEMDGCPAVLQEWVVGLPTPELTDWTGRPGAWLRLVRQAALGLQAAHAHGLAHGHPRPQRFLLTPGGELKLCGLGEPAWLTLDAEARLEPVPADDLCALGHAARFWLGPADRLSGRPGELQRMDALVARLLDVEHHRRITTAADLLEALTELESALPAIAADWEELMKCVRERLHVEAAGAELKRSA